MPNKKVTIASIAIIQKLRRTILYDSPQFWDFSVLLLFRLFVDIAVRYVLPARNVELYAVKLVIAL